MFTSNISLIKFKKKMPVQRREMKIRKNYEFSPATNSKDWLSFTRLQYFYNFFASFSINASILVAQNSPYFYRLQ